MEGTADKGARSVVDARFRDGRTAGRGGEEEMIPVVEVGTGVGYLAYMESRPEGEKRACRFEGRGKPGEEEDSGSNAGSREGAGRFFVPAKDGNAGWELVLLGEESIMTDIYCKSRVLVTSLAGYGIDRMDATRRPV